MSAEVRYGEMVFEVVVTRLGVRRIELPARLESPSGGNGVEIQLRVGGMAGACHQECLGSLLRFIESYLKGEDPGAGPPVDLSGMKAFSRKVLEATMRIPYGETRSYSWVAEMAGDRRAARAAGAALAMNPVPLLVPCHRVIQEDGELGGFRFGVTLKRSLLELESRSGRDD